MTKSEMIERRPLDGAEAGRPGGVPAKFDTEGRVQHFPGNTIICHLSPESPLFEALLPLYRELEAENPDTLITLLPPSSWHMTVFEGVCDQVRKPGFWPSDLPMDAPLEDCNADYSRKLQKFNLGFDAPFRLRIDGYLPRVNGIGLHLNPASASQESELRGLRDRLSDTLQIRHPSHEAYAFHLSIAYFIRFPSEQESAWLEAKLTEYLAKLPREFDLGLPEFCYFDTMFEFRRQFFLEP